ncbi:sensor domain-containing diguanylate cyclase [Fundidesulfovibrio terrae]|uniref:sensor domain-containing diguanylate cyclase n=1 Tax=Fundidesulfovibrio terrae TaxID=2922866 RepID=UPI001FB02B06|nr:sensor domain-containing diguanylate cyclase [Fundidesulfovibrio terrae]
MPHNGPFHSMDFLPLGIMVLDRNFEILFWNACLESWSGLGRGVAVGRDARELFPQLNRPIVTDRLLDLFEGAPPAVFSYHLHNHIIPAPLPGGALRLQHSVAYGVRGPGGTVDHVVLSLQDVTEIHNRLQENLRIKASLERENRLRKRIETKLSKLASFDMLTGLANRRHFLNLLIKEIRRAKRYGHPLCLVGIDVDHFKDVNDAWGHLAGDELLKAFAHVCQDEVRDVDSVGRLGGEEFGIILPETGVDEAMQVAERIRHRVKSIAILKEGGVISVTASLGVTCLSENQTIEDVLHAADQALYLAKSRGRDRVVQAPGM